MEQKELKIDVAALARQALKERQPGEDLDEALLRSCKKLYGETGAIAFQAVQSALAALAERNKVDREQALQQIIDGKSSVNVSTRTQVTHKVSTASLDNLPPEMRAEVERAMASGSSGKVVITRTMGGPKEGISLLSGAEKHPEAGRCQNCGYEFPSDLPSCPQCGKPKKRSLWSRLFGK